MTVPLNYSNRRPKPQVIFWFTVYSLGLAVLYVLVCLVGILMMLIPELQQEEGAVIVGGVYSCLGIVFAVPFGVAPFLPRRKWVWITHIVLICIGFTSCCLLPASLALLLFYIKPETKEYFDAGDKPRVPAPFNPYQA